MNQTAKWAVGVSMFGMMLGAASAQTINERNEMRASETRAAGKLAEASAACGTSKLDIDVDWTPLNGYDYKKAMKEKDAVVYTMGPVMGYYADHLGKLCKSDPQYKAAIAKITKVEFRPTAEYEPADYHPVVGSTVSGPTLTIRFRPGAQPSEIDLKKLADAF